MHLNNFKKSVAIFLAIAVLGVTGMSDAVVIPTVSASKIIGAKVLEQEMENHDLNEEAVQVIAELFEAENNHDWGTYVSMWCEEEQKIYNQLFQNEEYVKERKGILNVNSAKVMYCEKVLDESKLLLDDYIQYDDVNAYLVGVEYIVNNVTETFFNGVNYRYIYVGKEKGNYKVLGCTEVALEHLENLSKNDTGRNIVFENQNHSEKDIETAVSIRKDRIEKGFIEDGNRRVVKKIHNNANAQGNENKSCIYDNEKNNRDNIDKLAFGNTISNQGIIEANFIENTINNVGLGNVSIHPCGFVRGHVAETACNCYGRSTIDIYRTSTGKIETVSMGKYVKIVLNSEMVVSTSPKAALKAVTVCIHEFALWNQIYYAKYPDKGYDLKDSASDQRYDTSKWNNTGEDYKEIVRDVYNAVKNVHIHTGAYSSLFETGYVKNSSYDGDDYGTLYQDGACKKARNGKNYKEILRDYYDYTKQYGINDIGKIKFANLK